jgi:hypothetical protein
MRPEMMIFFVFLARPLFLKLIPWYYCYPHSNNTTPRHTAHNGIEEKPQEKARPSGRRQNFWFEEQE